MSKYFVKIKDGVPPGQRMHADDWDRYSEIVPDDGDTECPDGFLPVHKMLPRPEPGPGQRLAWTYTPTNGEMVKDYCLETTYSRMKLYVAVARAGLWDTLEAWLKSQDVEGVNAYRAFVLANDLNDGHPLFQQWFAAAKAALGVTDEQADAILAQSVAEVGA